MVCAGWLGAMTVTAPLAVAQDDPFAGKPAAAGTGEKAGRFESIHAFHHSLHNISGD
jgi:hypothetical protein